MGSGVVPQTDMTPTYASLLRLIYFLQVLSNVKNSEKGAKFRDLYFFCVQGKG